MRPLFEIRRHRNFDFLMTEINVPKLAYYIEYRKRSPSENIYQPNEKSPPKNKIDDVIILIHETVYSKKQRLNRYTIQQSIDNVESVIEWI
uniref:Uncharacterized protein n=1 Tax=Romanomermis culicivorax TaxID=13658 RepID=A0A915L1Z8_ROMCU